MGAKILIADDDEDIHYVYKRWLNADFEIIPAYNGHEAVVKYKVHKPDLTLMDIKMPVMPGDEAITQIFNHDPKANIVAVTAYAHDESTLGVPVLRKGFNKNTFMDTVHSGLEGNLVIPPEN